MPKGTVVALGGAIVVGLLLGGCPKKTKTQKPVTVLPKRAKIEVFTESAAVKAVIAHGKTLWVGTGEGIVAWDIEKRTARRITTDDGLPGNNILAMSVDSRGSLWVATSKGIAQYKGGSWKQYGDCPLKDTISTMIAVPGDTVYAGGSKGLARLRFENWKMVSSKLDVTALHYEPKKKTLWVGTHGKGLTKCVKDKCTPIPKEKLGGGNNVTSITAAPRGVMMVVAGDKGDRLVYRVKKRWFRYKIKPAQNLHWVRIARKRVLLAAGGHVYRLTEREDTETPPGPVELSASSSSAPEFITAKLKRRLPPAVTVVKEALGQLWIGSKSLGVARYTGDLLQFYRTNDLSDKARRLSVACTDEITCMICNGHSLFRQSGSSWQKVPFPDDTDAVYEWVGKDSSGKLIALVRMGEGRISVVRWEAGKWKAQELKPAIRASKGRLQVTVARVSPSGNLWIALAIKEGSDERGGGMAVVDLGEGTVGFHGGVTEMPGGGKGLEIPADITGVAFSGMDVWLGSRVGVIRVEAGGIKVTKYTENEGLASELIKDVAAMKGSKKVYVATSRGLGIFERGGWSFETDDEDEPRASRVLSVAMANDRSVWFGSHTGLHRYLRGQTVSFDDGDGLLEREVRSVAVDERGRVWVLHKEGISLVRSVR